MKIHFFLKLIVKVAENDIVFVSSEVTHRCVEQIKTVSHAERLYIRICGRVEFCILSAVRGVYIVNIAHKLKRGALAYVLVQRAAELCGYVVFAVGERSGSAEALHNAAMLAADTGFYLFSVDGTVALRERCARLDNSDLCFFVFLFRQLDKLISGKNTAGTRADNDNVVVHGIQIAFLPTA